jgi:CubicO group peptidase (beta-lactamase class C family)
MVYMRFSQIKYAGYGLANQTVDVTFEIRRLYALGQRTFVASNDLLTGTQTDPSPGNRKFLYVAWGQGGVWYSGVVGENDPTGITIPGTTEITSVGVSYASYGFGNATHDVTAIVQEQLRFGQTLFVADASMVPQGTSGQRQFLSIAWQQNGFAGSGVVGQNDSTGIAIPGFPRWGSAIYQAIGLQAVGFCYSVCQHGALVELGGAGWARPPWEQQAPDSVAITPQQLVTIGSISKSITATALLRLFQDKGFSTETQFYPLIRGAPALQGVTPGIGVDQILVSNLLTQASSLTEVNGYDWNDPMQLWQMIAKFVSQNVDVAGHGAPGTTYEYLNVNFGTLRGIIQYLSGEPYEDYVQRTVLSPAGMTATNITGSCDTLYYYPAQAWGSGWDILHQASWRSNGEEMGLFLSVLRGTAVLNADSIEDMFNARSIPYWINPHTKIREKHTVMEALGWDTGNIGGIRYWHHGGNYAGPGAAPLQQGSSAGIVRFDDAAQTDVTLLINTLLEPPAGKYLEDVQPVATIPQIYQKLYG